MLAQMAVKTFSAQVYLTFDVSFGFVSEPNFWDVVDASQMSPPHVRFDDHAMQIFANGALNFRGLFVCYVDVFASVAIKILLV